jgi:hypothetical protein
LNRELRNYIIGAAAIIIVATIGIMAAMAMVRPESIPTPIQVEVVAGTHLSNGTYQYTILMTNKGLERTEANLTLHVYFLDGSSADFSYHIVLDGGESLTFDIFVPVPDDLGHTIVGYSVSAV